VRDRAVWLLDLVRYFWDGQTSNFSEYCIFHSEQLFYGRYFTKRTQANVWVETIITRVTPFHTHFLLLDAGTLVPFCPRMSMHPNLAKSICLDLLILSQSSMQ
jgi:hypothetical protein